MVVTSSPLLAILKPPHQIGAASSSLQMIVVVVVFVTTVAVLLIRVAVMVNAFAWFRCVVRAVALVRGAVLVIVAVVMRTVWISLVVAAVVVVLKVVMAVAVAAAAFISVVVVMVPVMVEVVRLLTIVAAAAFVPLPVLLLAVTFVIHGPILDHLAISPCLPFPRRQAWMMRRRRRRRSRRRSSGLRRWRRTIHGPWQLLLCLRGRMLLIDAKPVEIGLHITEVQRILASPVIDDTCDASKSLRMAPALAQRLGRRKPAAHEEKRVDELVEKR